MGLFDDRYKKDAYFFVMLSLGRITERLERPRHITAKELLKGIREEAEDQFGPMAETVFAHWGIKNSLDFGLIVFKMVQEGLLLKTEDDKLEDFKDRVFFQNIFDPISAYRLPQEGKTGEARKAKKIEWSHQNGG